MLLTATGHWCILIDPQSLGNIPDCLKTDLITRILKKNPEQISSCGLEVCYLWSVRTANITCPCMSPWLICFRAISYSFFLRVTWWKVYIIKVHLIVAVIPNCYKFPIITNLPETVHILFQTIFPNHQFPRLHGQDCQKHSQPALQSCETWMVPLTSQLAYSAFRRDHKWSDLLVLCTLATQSFCVNVYLRSRPSAWTSWLHYQSRLLLIGTLK